MNATALIQFFLCFISYHISTCSKNQLQNPQYRSTLYETYNLISVTYNVKNSNRRSSSFICSNDEPKLKVVANLKKTAHEISKALFDEAMFKQISTSNQFEHGIYVLGTEEVTYSKKGIKKLSPRNKQLVICI